MFPTDDPKARLRKTPLGHDDKISISRALQVMTLEEIARAARPGAGELAFHGGTAIALTRGSPRWSEDLDFMASPELVSRLAGKRLVVERGLQLRISVMTPGAKVEVQDRTGMEGRPAVAGDVDRWLIRWEDPSRHGVVKIKAEFYVCPEARIARYDTEPVAPMAPEARSALALPSATPLAFWADKIVAIANRPAVKYRDVHDLGFLAPLLARLNPSEADRAEALAASMGAYDRTPAQILEGLDRELVTEGLADDAAWREDMRRWFAEAAYGEIAASGALEGLRRGFLEEFATGRRLVTAMAAPDSAADAETEIGEEPEW
jgi:hypothetical protein